MRRQHAAVELADAAKGASTRVRGCGGEHLRGSEPPGDEYSGTLYGRRQRLPGDALMKLDAGLGLVEEVPVRHRPEIVVPTGWSPGSVGKEEKGASTVFLLYGRS